MAVWGPSVRELVEITDEVSRLAAASGSTDAHLDALTLQGVVAWLTSADAASEADAAYSALAAGTGESAAQWQGDAGGARPFTAVISRAPRSSPRACSGVRSADGIASPGWPCS